MDDPYDFWLSHLDLSNCSLQRARFSDGLMEAANFDFSDLSFAQFHGCDLRRASFRGALLIGAEIADCNLDGVDAFGSEFGDTRLIRVDLGLVEGLASVTHRYQSVVETTTIERTSASLLKQVADARAVLTFLSLAGVAETIVDVLRVRLIGRP